MLRSNTWLITTVVIILLLGINNTVYYFTTKKSLEESLSHEMSSVAKQIEISIEQSRLGAEKYQELIGHQLRSVSIAAQYALDPDIEKVDNEQLVELSDRLGVLHITLLKRTEDNIVLYKSSDPQQLGLNTSSWYPWYQAFNELFDNHQVTIDWGQSLSNFWTGPFELATSDTSKIRKWGYYYDGTTNYIIDPYVSYDMQEEYEKITGANPMIEQTLRENPSILEITVINPKTFPDGMLRTKTETGEDLDHITTQPIIYGTYEYQDPEDVGSVQEAFNTNEAVTINTDINGKHVLKMFIPVPIAKVASIVDENSEPVDHYILSIVSDYQSIQDTLDKQFLNIGLIILVVSVLSVIIVFVTMRYFRKSRDRVVGEAQARYSDEINQLFHSIRVQRHDFLNHVQMIHSLAEMNKVKELRSYTKDLAGEIHVLSDIINIGNPAIAALVRSKLSQAESHKVRFESHFQGMSSLELGVKTLDLTRMLGNLVDNAIDEAMKYPDEEKRWVALSGSDEQHYLLFSVSNYCQNPDDLKNKSLFEAGYSNKGNGHQGLGLSIVKEIVEQYKGTISLDLDMPNQVSIVIIIPH
ncbi:sensor histidine kinase [Paenibacillus abyssi]|uniref:Histidine kinase domain-containing protein n=1 Tax=Paenibacillus abyssi TaxID=1340531 RepID=A0A917CST1_9BACL|nr:GHKL domain-containing protein [Paenibacillus abyssi]GGF98390.1 hypothetical protein GCM10010916_14550 [Paenibacillus abyssi]